MRHVSMLALVLAAAWALPAHAAFDLRVVTPEERITVAPGSTADWTLHFQNHGDASSSADVRFGLYVNPYDDPPGYEFSMRQPGPCGTLQPIDGVGPSGSFSLPAVDPGASITCAIRVSRLPASTSDVGLIVQQEAFDVTPGNSISRYAGLPVTASLRAENEGPLNVVGTRAEQTLRVFFLNDGPVDLQRVSFGHCVAGESNPVEVNFPGACIESDQPYGVCFMGSRSFEMGKPVRAGETASCLVRVSERWPLTSDPGHYLALSSPQPNTLGGWTAVIDGGSVALLDIGAVDVAASRHVIPAAGPVALLLLAGGVLLVLATRKRLHQ
jgi:hypothetical protein